MRGKEPFPSSHGRVIGAESYKVSAMAPDIGPTIISGVDLWLSLSVVVQCRPSLSFLGLH